jgi:hypothetical protein
MLPQEEFDQIRHDLLEECERVGREHEEHRAMCQELAALVSPWLTRECLLKTDSEIRVKLLAHCQEISARLGYGKRPPLIGQVGWAVIGTIVGMALATALLMRPDFWQSAAQALTGQGWSWQADFGHLEPIWPWLLVGLIGFIIFVRVISRTRRY